MIAPARYKRLRAWRQVWLLAGAALFVLLLVVQHHFRVVMVVGPSMEPTYRTGNLIVVDRHTYLESEPQRGDIIVALRNREYIVKRVVGLPGEEVEVTNGTVFVNRVPIPESQFGKSMLLNIRRGRLSEGRFAVVGDNRQLPVTEGVHAIITKDQILGKVIF